MGVSDVVGALEEGDFVLENFTIGGPQAFHGKQVIPTC